MRDDRFDASGKLFVCALLAFLIAYMAFTGHQPTVFRNEQGQVTGVYDLTALFQIVSWSGLAIGSILLAAAIRRWRRKEPDEGLSELGAQGLGRRLFVGRPFWVAFNAGLVLLSFWVGYAEVSPPNGLRTNADIILFIGILVVMPVFVIGSVSLARPKRLQTPAWNRFPLNWKGDPLQALFVMTSCSLAALVGSLVRLASSGNDAVWMVATHASLLFGLLIGQAIVYRVFRAQIGQSQESEGVD